LLWLLHLQNNFAMLEQNSHSVLFIDDQSNIYFPTLKPAAEAAGFDLYTTDNVLDGLNFINAYTETLSAIILDYSFPTGEMQGYEALRLIKKSYADLPVIMLTDSDEAADIDKVVECMKDGAYNYIGRRSLNPLYLFQVVEKAVRESKLQIRINAITAEPEKQHFFTTVKADCDNIPFNRLGIFGFELLSVNKHGNELEVANLKRIGLLWHQNFLKAISTIYFDEIRVNLKYITENSKIKCRIIFTIFGIDDKLDKIINNVQHDVKAFFLPDKIDNTQPYVFEEICNPDVLYKVNKQDDSLIYNVFYREPIKIKSRKILGFNPIENLQSLSHSGYKPDEIFSMPVNFSYNNELLFSALLNQKEYAEIDIQLIPKRLLKVEIDYIKQVIKECATLDIENLSNAEKTIYIEYLQKFVVNTKDKFAISVILKRQSSNWSNHLKTGISSYFFGLNDNVKYAMRAPDKLFRFCTSNDFIINQLPFFYSLNDAIQAFRLPIPDAEGIPGIKQQSHKFHFMPDNLAKNGILLGVKNDIHPEKEIKIDEQSVARHLYIMGQTGTGKSTMLKTMIKDCLDKNYGFTLIDPHGDLFDQVLKLIPKNKKNKVFILDTSDAENSIKLNPLLFDEKMPEAKSLVVNEIMRIFSTLYDMRSAGGPMFENYFKNGLLLIMDEKVEEKFGKGSLADMSKVFCNNTYRKELLMLCGNQNIVDFFKAAESMSGESVFANYALYITSKLNRFVDDYYLAPIITSKTNNIDFKSLINDGSIFLVKMDKGLIGSDNTSLLGQIILSKLFLAGMSRSKVNIDERKPHYIFIDEFQNFLNSDVGTALSEVRKYGLNLILANQTLGQLNEYLIQSLLGNVGSLVFFRPGIYDFEKLKYYLYPDFTREDVLKLPNFNCISRLLVNNIPSDPFVFQTKNI